MKTFVIGVSSKLDETLAVAMDPKGGVLGGVKARSCSYVTVGRGVAQRRASEMIDELLLSFHGDRERCQCLLVSAAGIDSPKTKQLVTECFAASHMLCPVLCLNDGNVALYTATKGLGVLAVSGKGSIAVGRNAQGQITRSGGYPVTILGNEGSAQWLALEAMHLASQWLDGSVERTPLIARLDRHFRGLDIEKLTECAGALRRRPIDTMLSQLVIDSAREGDAAALDIVRRGAGALFKVAQTCVKKLGFGEEEEFLSGVWGDVFAKSEEYLAEYTRLFQAQYPRSRIVFSRQEEAQSAALMALDYLEGLIPYIASLQ
ncbi:BadF/BadG/BcrA/BcrD ATPase family protein [Beduinella massiliensis]|uniref:BadF/BadG/BcrA/BcrD ATPase family protein n=1 Tax=Beduinella massiliensis TaxID=1852363 RepID=UPI000C8157DC